MCWYLLCVGICSGVCGCLDGVECDRCLLFPVNIAGVFAAGVVLHRPKQHSMSAKHAHVRGSVAGAVDAAR